MVTLEYCGECETEVLIQGKLEIQICPECGAEILPCHYCIDIFGGCWIECPYEFKAKKKEE
jgi:predicted RNA-binding Zn-ribbon protein involved in translation (DUF1610 family)